MHMILLYKLNSSSGPSFSVGDGTKCPTKVDVSLKKELKQLYRLLLVYSILGLFIKAMSDMLRFLLMLV